MGSTTNLFLPLHVRNEDVLKVLARIMGEAFHLATFDKQKTVSFRPHKTIQVPVAFDPAAPAAPDNPWHVQFEREREGLGLSAVTPNDYSFFRMEFVDAAKNPYSWSFFTDYDQRDSDGLFVRRAKLLSPSSTITAVACCVRLAKFFGGDVFYDDGKEKDEPDLRVEDSQAKFPLMAKGTTSDNQWYAFQNALRDEPMLTAAELEAAGALAAYENSERYQTFLRAVRSHDKAQALRQNLPQVEEEADSPATPGRGKRSKPRF